MLHSKSILKIIGIGESTPHQNFFFLQQIEKVINKHGTIQRLKNHGVLCHSEYIYIIDLTSMVKEHQERSIYGKTVRASIPKSLMGYSISLNGCINKTTIEPIPIAKLMWKKKVSWRPTPKQKLQVTDDCWEREN